MAKFVIIILTTIFISCSTSQPQNKIKYIPVHTYQTGYLAKIIAPRNYKPERPVSQGFVNSNIEIKLVARQFVKGDVIYIEVLRKKNISQAKLAVNTNPVNLTERKWGYRGYFTIHPEYSKNDVNLEISYNKSGQRYSDNFNFMLNDKEFPVSKSSLDVGKFSRADITGQKDIEERIQQEYAEKQKIFENFESDYLVGTFAHPRDTHLTSSPFYIKRVYQKYIYKNGKKVYIEPTISYHRGFDFLARTGDPVFAMAPGKVTLAKNLYYEGNCVMIDHGNKMLTIYMHMSKLKVTKGQMVKPGDLIGFVGSTGISTGPHLHVSLFVNRVPTDPMSLIMLPLRN